MSNKHQQDRGAFKTDRAEILTYPVINHEQKPLIVRTLNFVKKVANYYSKNYIDKNRHFFPSYFDLARTPAIKYYIISYSPDFDIPEVTMYKKLVSSDMLFALYSSMLLVIVSLMNTRQTNRLANIWWGNFADF